MGIVVRIASKKRAALYPSAPQEAPTSTSRPHFPETATLWRILRLNIFRLLWRAYSMMTRSCWPRSAAEAAGDGFRHPSLAIDRKILMPEDLATPSASRTDGGSVRPRTRRSFRVAEIREFCFN